MKYIDAEKLKAEIERQIHYARDAKYPKGSIENERATAIVAVCLDLLSFIDSLSEEPDKSLEEEIREYMSNEDNNPFDWDWRDKRDCASHFAEWQKEQMMKDAVEGEVVKDISNKLAVTAKINLDGFKFGDKVRIIVLPKEDEK